MRPYQIADVEATMMLFMALYPLIKKYEGLFRAYRNEIELIRATVIMESRGIKLHKAEARSLIDKLSVEKDDCVSRANALCGFPINLNSDKQVRELLFGRMKIQPLGKTDGGLPAVDKNTIEAIDEQHRGNKAVHEILDLILHQRAATKGIAIIKGYIELVDKDDIIHPHINTNQADTGRQSSTNPNLQNVAKELNIKTRYAVPARRCFTARKGYFLLLCDYAGIEMRLGVQGTNSERLIKLVEQDFDFHDAMAKSFYGDRYTKCTDKQQKKALRSSAKNTRFAMFYGAGIETAARTLGLSVEETREGYVRDREMFPEFYQFMDRCTEHAKEYGWIETFFGRRLFVDTNKPYSATDYCIQGTAAEVLKRAQVRIVNLLQAMDCGIYLLLPVHDELIFEYPYSQVGKLKEFRNTVTGLMTSFDEITVKLSVEWKISTSTWDRAREIK
jgi:DNA polymerase-1